MARCRLNTGVRAYLAPGHYRHTSMHTTDPMEVIAELLAQDALDPSSNHVYVRFRITQWREYEAGETTFDVDPSEVYGRKAA